MPRKTASTKASGKKASSKSSSETSAAKSASKAATKKKPAAKKAPVAKKVPAKKPAATKAPAKKVTAKKPVAKKAPAKKAPEKKPVVAKKAPAKKPVAKKAPAKKPVAKKPVAKKEPPKKAGEKKTPIKKTAPKESAKTETLSAGEEKLTGELASAQRRITDLELSLQDQNRRLDEFRKVQTDRFKLDEHREFLELSKEFEAVKGRLATSEASLAEERQAKKTLETRLKAASSSGGQEASGSKERLSAVEARAKAGEKKATAAEMRASAAESQFIAAESLAKTLRAELDTMKANVSADAIDPSAHAELIADRDRIRKELERDRKEQKGGAGQLDEIKVKYSKLLKRNERLDTQLQDALMRAKGADVGAAEELASLKERVIDLEMKLASAPSDEKLREVQFESAALQDERDNLRSELSRIKSGGVSSEIETLRKRLDKLTEERNAFRGKATRLESTITALRAELSSSRAG